jgi:uncharacterized NAD-dependent epimerase/dehydratase family protein
MALKRYAILAEGAFDEEAKTATGVLRYAESPTVAVIDSTRTGTVAADHVPGLEGDVPVVGTLAEALPYRRAILDALHHGLDVESGLHDFLGDDPEFDAAARLAGREIHDLRKAPHGLSVPTGANLAVPTHTVLTVGSDCALGKMTVCLELDAEARRRGLPSVFVPTGQTGIAIAGWGIAVDEVISDFVAGAAERLVVEGHERGGDGAILWIEGQGSLNHPYYSGVTLGLLHGSAPHALVFVHEPGRETIDGDPRYAIPSLAELIDDQVRMARHVRHASVVAVALKTNKLDEEAARTAIAEVERETALVADDPVRFGAGRLLDAVLSARG